jgi:hypothetical protein
VGNSRTHDWTKKRIALLSEMWMSGYSSGECARRLCVSRNAAIGKLRRLGLLGRDRPQLPIMARRVNIQLPTDFPTVINRPPKMRPNTRPLPPPEPYQAPPPPPLPPIGRFSLLDLRAGHCRWPNGERPDYRFCGAPQLFDSSYCAEHHALAHNRGSQRDFDRMAAQALGGKLFTSRAGIEQ